MSSTRRRTTSNNGRDSKSHHESYGGWDESRTTIQRRLPSSLRTLSPWISPAAYNNRNLLYGMIILGIFTIYLLVRSFPGLGAVPVHHSENLATTASPFPNAGSVTAQGRAVLQSLSLGAIPVSNDKEVTFVIPLPRQNARNTLPLLTRVQLTNCRIHLLVHPDQVTEARHLLDIFLPLTQGVRVFPSVVEGAGTALATLHHAKHVKTPWMWIMPGYFGDEFQENLDHWLAHIATTIPRVQVPIGVRGVRLTESGVSCISSTDQPEPVAFLVPPFLAPTSLLVESESGIIADGEANVWASLGERIGRVARLGMGGVVFPIAPGNPAWCKSVQMVGSNGAFKVDDHMISALRGQYRLSTAETIRFTFLLPNQEALQLAAPTACRMLQNGHGVHITVGAFGDKDAGESRDQQYLNHGCHLHYTIGPTVTGGYRGDVASLEDDWCASGYSSNRVLIIGDLEGDLKVDRISKKRLCATAIVYLPKNDLGNSEWLAMLSLEEWRAWDDPVIELAVITHDRPWSLKRLLNSVKRAHYFGDSVNVIINLEQTADLETRRIAEGFTMGPCEGHVTVRHRIVYAGLMTAVVEAWHPHGNHSYGVMLEDDVELSSMFYAWIKFCVLRYRYGASVNESSQLYGISLYQPKVSELHMEGRRPFDARTIFRELGIRNPHTPYLSQVPCSWGAVYFPEHWREFQKYLTLRLSEYVMPVTDIVVPDLRSNKWSRSWKKFFNEMGKWILYLRGYVSLYPNYDHFVSLSTNHLEMGEHVPANINEEKQKQYFLPLMEETGQAELYPGTARGVKLLDLPFSTLPKWTDLPVLDLWGDISTLERLRSVGLARRTTMSACYPEETQADALEFLCYFGKNPSATGKSHKHTPSTLVEEDGPDLMQG